MMGKQRWCEHLKDIKLSPSHAGAGGTYNGQDLKAIIQYDNLQKLKPKIPNGEVITDYMHAINNLHMMCVAKSVVPYDVWGICARFRDTFTKVYKLGLGLSATPKIHICWTHIPEWFQLEETGKDTLYMADCSNTESCHGAVRRLEERSNLEVRRNRGGERERRCLETTIGTFNWHNSTLADQDEPMMEVAEEPMMEVMDEPMMEVMDELNTLALDNNNNSASTDVSFNLRYGLNNLKLFVKVAGVEVAEVVIDINGNVVVTSQPGTDHTYSSLVPLAQDTRSRMSLIKVSLPNIYIFY